MKKISVIVPILALLAGILFPIVSADTQAVSYHNSVQVVNTEAEALSVVPDSSNISALNGCRLSEYGGNPALAFEEEESSADILINPDVSGAYYIRMLFVPNANSNYNYSSIGLQLNGSYPFDEAKELELSWRWLPGEITTDSRGNEMLSSLRAVEEETSVYLTDPTGRQNDPLLFDFKAGENKVTVVCHTGNMTLLGLYLESRSTTADYALLKEEYQEKGYGETKEQYIKIEAEDYKEASSSTLAPDADQASASVSPADSVHYLYNIISGDRYNSAGQWLLYEFTPEESGLYEISFHTRQNDKSGFSVTRKLYINDDLPFSECAELTFDYGIGWQSTTLGDGEENYRFYFEKGKTYTVKLEAAVGSLSDIILMTDDLVDALNSLYRSVIMVVGSDSDKYRDYRLNKVVPDFDSRVDEIEKSLNEIVDELAERNGGKSGSSLTSFHSMINRIKSVKKNSDYLAKNLSAFKDDIAGISSWSEDAKTQPLDLDYIEIHSPGHGEKGGFVQGLKGFFKGLGFQAERIAVSFTEDYGVIGEIYDSADTLEVWLSGGRDQLNAVKKLVDNSFIPESGRNVNLSLVTVDVRTAVLAGTAPDAMLFSASDMPVNLAIRSAVEDLTKFEGFEEVEKRFFAGTLKPFSYHGGVYALPLSETFPMLFVRTDVFEELGLSVPETWDEVYEVATVLQRNNLEVGIPSNIGMFATLLLQNGGSFYNETLTATCFDDHTAIDAFSMWVGLFTKYDFPLTFDLYNRFITGEMPMGIADYTTYTKIKTASPQLSGRWDMFMIPGIRQSDGTINRSLSISAATGTDISPGLAQSITCAMIFSKSENKQGAWEFLDWFTSDTVQSSYEREIEDTLGPISRYNSANTEAFKTLPWSKAERELLFEQWSRVVTLEEIPGNYSVTRELNNAFRKVLYSDSNPTDTIYRYNQKINKELTRKQ